MDGVGWDGIGRLHAGKLLFVGVGVQPPPAEPPPPKSPAERHAEVRPRAEPSDSASCAAAARRPPPLVVSPSAQSKALRRLLSMRFVAAPSFDRLRACVRACVRG